jgi:hypothetical protein
MFIALSTVVSITFLPTTLLYFRYIHYCSSQLPVTSVLPKISIITSVTLTILATLTLPLLTIFDFERHQSAHLVPLPTTFIAYIFAAVFLCMYAWIVLHPFQKRCRTPTEDVAAASRSALVTSLILKIVLVLIELGLIVIFAVLNQIYYNVAGVLEWLIAGVFGVYIGSFVADFWITR